MEGLEMQGIYCIENIISGRKYYGSSMNVTKRLTGHKRELRKQIHHNIQLQRSVNKHGIENFVFYLLEETYFTNRKDLLNHEQYYLDKNINGYNMAPANGGDILSNHPNKIEIRKQILETHRQTITTMSSEERKIKFGRPGKTNPNWRNGGISHKLCPVCNHNQIRNESTTCGACRDRTGINNPFHGKTHNEQTKQYLREIHTGDNSWIKGIDPALLPYTKQYTIQYPNGERKQVAGLKAIAEEFKVSVPNTYATIQRMAKGTMPKRGVFVGVNIQETADIRLDGYTSHGAIQAPMAV